MLDLVADYLFRIAVHPDGRLEVVWLAKGFTDLTGFTLDEMRDPAQWPQLVPPDQMPVVDGFFAELLAGKTAAAELRIQTKEGRRRWLHLDAKPEWDATPSRVSGIVGLAKDHTEERERQAAQRLSAEIIANMAEGVCLVRADDTRIAFANSTFERMFGYEPGELAGQPVDVLTCPTPEKDAAAVRAEILGQLQRSGKAEYEVYNVRKDGSPFWCRARTSVLDHPEHGRVYVAVQEDISERRRKDHALRASDERFRLLAETIGEVFWMSTPDLSEMTYVSPGFEKIWARPVADLYADPRAWIEAIHPDDVAAVLAALEQHRHGEYMAEYRIVRPDGSVRWISDRGYPVKDASGGLRGMAGIAEDITERKLVELELVTHRERLAELVAERTRELAVANDALRESEAHLRATFEQAAVGIAHVALDGRWLRLNRRYCEIVGYEHEELLSLRFQDITHPEDLASDLAFVRQLLAGEIATYSMEKRYIRKDRGIVWVNLTASLVRKGDGAPDYLIAVVEDINERQRVEQALRDSEEKFKYVFERSVIGKSITSPTGELHANAALCEMLGYSEPELQERTWQDITPPEDIEPTQRVLAPLVAGEQDRARFIKRYLHKNGSIVWTDVSTSLRRDESGRPLYFMASVSDITERKRAEQALRDSEERLRTLVESLPQLIWTCRADGPCDYLSPQWVRYTGVPEAEQLGFGWARQIHPDDWPGLEAEWTESVKTGASFDVEFRIRRADGEYRWFKTRAIPIRDSDGRILKWFGSNTDIDDEKRLAETLSQEKEFSDAMVDSLPGIFYLFDRHGKFLRWNRNFEAATGYSRDEVATRHPLDFFTGDDKDLIAKRIREVFTTGQSAAEASLVAKGGATTPFLFTGVRLVIGTEPYLIGVGIDISERRAAERALRESEERFRRAITEAPVPMIIHTEDDAVLHMSKGWTRYSGYTLEDMPTIADWTARAYGERRAMVKEYIDALFEASETVSNGEWAIRAKDGGERTWDFYTTPIGRTKDNLRMLLSLAVDVTERRRAREELATANAELEERVGARTRELANSVAQLEAANRELEAFSYTVSHDLRAPLRAIDGFSKILLAEHGSGLTPDGQRYLKLVRESSQNMGQLIDDLLAFSRLSRQPLARERVDPAELVAGALDGLRSEVGERNVRFELGGLPSCEGDPGLLGRVFANLLSNAIKFTRPRDPALIEVGFLEHADAGAYFVRDNGVGFDMRYKDKLFRVFSRLHRFEDFEGTGVGLAIVQRIVHRHGGRVWAEAEPERGATFFFTLTGGDHGTDQPT